MNPTEILPAPVLQGLDQSENKWQQEYHAFHRMLPELLKTFPNKYVAIHDGQVVDSGPDLVEVAMRSYSRYGYIPIYFDLVTDQPPPPVRLPSPRLPMGGGMP